jgi:hypothetical protein
LSERRSKAKPGLPKKSYISNLEDEDQADKVRDEAKDREQDLEFILSSARGRRWIYDLIHGPLCHVRSQSFYPGDPASTGMNEGARMVGENLLEEIRGQHFDRWLQMMSENHGD